jgi:hypothetical protein
MAQFISEKSRLSSPLCIQVTDAFKERTKFYRDLHYAVPRWYQRTKKTQVQVRAAKK